MTLLQPPMGLEVESLTSAAVDPASSTPRSARLREALLQAVRARNLETLTSRREELEPSVLVALLPLLVLEPLEPASALYSSTLWLQKSLALPSQLKQAARKEELRVVSLLPPLSPPSLLSRLAPLVASVLAVDLSALRVTQQES
jgi:hypothetical protein